MAGDLPIVVGAVSANRVQQSEELAAQKLMVRRYGSQVRPDRLIGCGAVVGIQSWGGVVTHASTWREVRTQYRTVVRGGVWTLISIMLLNGNSRFTGHFRLRYDFRAGHQAWAKGT